MLKKYKPYCISVLIALAVGGLSALLTKNNMAMYNTINKPALSPPMILFPIVWCILFILMGIGSGGVYKTGKIEGKDSSTALKIYGLQLIVNFFWTIIFFNMKAYLFSFIWILLLIVLIIVMIIEFKRICSWGAWLQIPYLLWTLFAAYLNFGVYLLNR